MKLSILILSGIFFCAICLGQTAFGYYNLGLVKYNLLDFKGAIADFDKALEINPEYTIAYNLRGAAKFKIGDYIGAIEDYTKAIEIDSAYSMPLKYSVRESKGGISEIDKLNVIDPKYAFAYFNRGLARKEIDDYEGAIADYSTAIQINPGFAEAYYSRAAAKYKISDEKGACSDWMKAGELGYKNAYDAIREYCKSSNL